MQVVILCGGKGTRMFPYTEDLPKPLITIGNKPVLWHVINLYAQRGHKDFLILIGFRGDMVKEYFTNPANVEPDWKIEFLDTGIDTTKGDRLRMAKDKIKGDNFILAYGDDLSDIDINKVIEMHERNGKIVTITTVPLISNFGIVDINENNEIVRFREKPKLNHWISGGFIVLSKRIFGFIKPGGDETDAFELLAAEGQVQAFKHDGFWKTMNTIQDVNELNEMWKSGELKKILNTSF